MDLPTPVYCRISGWVVDFAHAIARVISRSPDYQLVDATNPAIAYPSNIGAYHERYIEYYHNMYEAMQVVYLMISI